MCKTASENLSSQVGAVIMERRKRKGFTQTELAEQLGIEQHSLSRIEKGVIAPKFSRLRDIALALDCTVADLFRQTSDPALAKAEKVCELLNELSPPLQDIVLNHVEQTVSTLKHIPIPH